MRECRAVVNGLSFYVPGNLPTECVTAYERYENLDGPKCLSACADEPDGVYVLTPRGEVELASLDVAGLLAVETDLKRVGAARRDVGSAIAKPTSSGAATLLW